MDERLVRRLWLAGGWPRGALRTSDGRELQVVYPGRAGRGAGPDLRDAIVALPDATLLRGDVELHVRTSDWRAHGHDGDPRYANVVLHVVWRDDAPPSALPVVALGDLREELLFERLRAPACEPEPYHEWLRTMPPDERAGLLERLGDERLSARALRIAADLHALGPAEALHRALLDALGYSQNRSAFGQLAHVVSAAELQGWALEERDEARAEALVLARLFAAGGLLDEGRASRLTDAAGRELVEAYARIAGEGRGTRVRAAAGTSVARASSDGGNGAVSFRRGKAVPRGGPPEAPAGRASLAGVSAPLVALGAAPPSSSLERVAPGAWELVGVRLANRPARRIAALARLAVRERETPLHEAVLDVLRRPEPRAALRGQLELVTVGPGAQGAADYWLWHHDFGRRLPGAPLALVGGGRARAMLANVLLPFALAMADARGDGELEGAVRAVWAVAPGGGENWILAEMRPLLAGLSLARARHEQGAIELYQRCCAERRCITCPAASVAQLARG